MNDADLQERMQLAIERISEIKEEDQTIWDTLAKDGCRCEESQNIF